MKNKLYFLIIIVSNSMMANITLPSIFSDDMVLQRNSEIKIWGWANPKEEVKITPSWNNQEYKIVADSNANWSITIPTPKEGGPYIISLNGYNSIILKNIMIGEVWLCSGQSNMEMNANWGIKNGDEEATKATNTNIRFFSVEKASAETPQNNLSGNWTECSPQIMKKNSAVAYFFANRITEDLRDVPIGMIVSAWGATSAEVWIPKKEIESNQDLLEASKKINPNEYCPVGAGKTFNAMINPLIGYKIAGVLWYQGESNVGSTIYDKTFSALITSWRSLWKQDFPFYFVQIAPYKNGDDRYSSVLIRDFQRRTLQLPNTAMVVTSDISTTDDIHPKDKKSVGVRLANLALSNIYKTNSNVVNGPLYKEQKITKNKITVLFDYADGLYFKDKKNNQFEIAGSDTIFYNAKAEIKNNEIILTSDKVKKPTKVRFAWENAVQSQLFNKANLPASSFISE
ncbi:MAG: sialate O-acetylesterase [Flavobacterium sp.]|uniref:sialate O-acetylesterase n=1 Tax=Flavobacterium sp. TaxID=239 RepID=UPI0022C74E33|nr:sialate O-acetylesterase [Flavobacterium sp.]MCZ8196914.1 sialate O-acetylesterase [Flavobacterium sp.]